MRCRWVRDSEVPGGRFLVPGCWNRVLYGDHAECHCTPSDTPAEPEAETQLDRVERLLGELVAVLTQKEGKP